MESYSKISKRINCDGIAIIYVLAAILVVGLIGTVTVKMATGDAIGGSLLHRATEARFAAKSGIERLQNEIEVDPVSCTTMIKFLVSQDTADFWVYGDETTWDSLSPSQKYRLKAIDFDIAKSVLEVISYGEGNDGKNEARALIEVFNVDIQTSAVSSSGFDNHFALYIGDVDPFPMNGPIDVDGNTFFPGDIGFDLSASNSRFRGIFRSTETASIQRWQGTYTFDSTAYFGSKVTCDGGMLLNFNGLTAFNDGIYSVGSNNAITFNDRVFVDDNIEGSGSALTLDANGNEVVYGSDFSFGSASWSDYDDEGKSTEEPRWLKDSVGIGEACVPVFNRSVIPTSKILKWSELKNPSSHGYSGLLDPVSHDPGWDELDQIMANEIFNYAMAHDKDWNGIAVVEVDANMWTERGIPEIEYDSATSYLAGKVESNSDAEFLMSFKDTILAHESPTYESHTLTSSKPYSEGLTWGTLRFDDIPPNFVNAKLSIEFYDLDVIEDEYSKFTLQESAELYDHHGNQLFNLDVNHPDAARFNSNVNEELITPLPDSLFTTDFLELSLKMKCWINLKPGYSSYTAGNGIDKFFNIRIDGFINTDVATDTSVAVQSPTFNGKMILLVNDGAKLQPTSAAGEFFPIETEANMMIYGAPGSTIENLGDWEFYRGYLHIDSGATISMGGASNSVDPLMGAIHIRDNAIVKGWYPLNAGVPNLVYDSTVINSLNYDGLMTYECGTDTTSGSVTETVTITPIVGESNQRLVSIRY